MANSARTAIFSSTHLPSGRRPERINRASKALAALAALLFAAGPAAALSQIPGEEGLARPREGIVTVPLPPLFDGVRERSEPGQTPADGGADDWPQPETGEPGLNEAPSFEDDQPAPPRRPEAEPLPISYGDDNLPTPVRDLRARLIEIARAGEIEALRPYLETGAEPTGLAVQPVEGDPIAFLKQTSGDGQGVEILAILLEVLLAGHVLVGEGTEEAIHVWPYFTQVPLDRLSKPQMVELFEIVTAGDYAFMVENGAYDFYRVGISPGGRLEFFLTGD